MKDSQEPTNTVTSTMRARQKTCLKTHQNGNGSFKNKIKGIKYIMQDKSELGIFRNAVPKLRQDL